MIPIRATKFRLKPRKESKNASLKIRRAVLGEIKEKEGGGLYYTKPFRELMNCILDIVDFFDGTLKSENAKNPDYIKYISSKDPTFIAGFTSISDSYKAVLSKDVKTNIKTHIKEIALDMFVHNPDIIATDVTVYRAMQIFSPLLNYIFDVLVYIHSIP